MAQESCPLDTPRTRWLELLERLALPVLHMGEERSLHRSLLQESAQGVHDRHEYAILEAVGRLLCGMAPWLELDLPSGSSEARLQHRMRDLALATLQSISDPSSPDAANFDQGAQPLVDTAFLAHALLRSPTVLSPDPSSTLANNLRKCLLRTRSIRPGFNNWLLFAGMVETALSHRLDCPADPMRLDYAVRQHMQWYKGDGVYGDGPEFHADYYNSYVIQPMLDDIVCHLPDEHATVIHPDLRVLIRKRHQRWAEVLERFIAPDGTFPALGRSIAYRCGAFQSLAHLCLLQDLPQTIPPPKARCALGAVLHRTLAGQQNYHPNGLLTIGLCGRQPSLGEQYISTGSLYLASTAFLPLGLPPDNDFWAGEAQPWSGRLLWEGEDSPGDKALAEKHRG